MIAVLEEDMLTEQDARAALLHLQGVVELLGRATGGDKVAVAPVIEHSRKAISQLSEYLNRDRWDPKAGHQYQSDPNYQPVKASSMSGRLPK